MQWNLNTTRGTVANGLSAQHRTRAQGSSHDTTLAANAGPRHYMSANPSPATLHLVNPHSPPAVGVARTAALAAAIRLPPPRQARAPVTRGVPVNDYA